MRLPRPTDLKGPIASGTIRTTLVMGLRLVVQAGTLLVVARMLGPERFGAFAGVAALAVVLGTLSTFGTHLVLMREVSREPSRRKAVLAYALPTTLLSGGVLLSIYLLISVFLLHEAEVSPSVLIAIGITETLMQPLLALPAAEHLALGRIARAQLLRLLPLGLRLTTAVTVLLLRPGDPLSAYGYGYLVASLVALGLATATMPAPWPRLWSWRLPTKEELHGTVGYAVINITATTPAELDKTLAARLLSLPAAGLYAAGTRVIGAATLPVIAMMLSSLPRLFREGVDQPRRTDRLLRWIFAVALGYSIVLAGLLWLIAPAFVTLFGAEYTGIEHTIHLLCLAVPGMALRVAAGHVLMALGKPWMRAGFEVAGVLVLITSALVFVAHLGATGMPLALICSEWMMVIIGSWMLLLIRHK